MAAPIGPGDWLLCVLSDSLWDGTSVTAGQVYCVERIIATDAAKTVNPCTTCGDDGPAIGLVGLHSIWGGWCHCGFKPLGGGERLTAPPARVCEPA